MDATIPPYDFKSPPAQEQVMKREPSLYDYAEAKPKVEADKKEWDAADKTLEATFMALLAADWRQTQQIVRNPDNLRERNAILGDHPSKEKVNAYFGAVALTHMGLAHLLPDPWRKVMQGVTIAVEGNMVNQNQSGIKTSGDRTIKLDAVRW